MITDRLLEAIKTTHTFGTYRTRDGQEVDEWIDINLILMQPYYLDMASRWVATTIMYAYEKVDAVGCPAISAVPLTLAVAMKLSVPAFFDRGAKKTHGSQKRIEGPSVAGKNVVLIDDVVSSGYSLWQTLQAVRKEGGTYLGAISVVDRQELSANASAALRVNDYFYLYQLTADKKEIVMGRRTRN